MNEHRYENQCKGSFKIGPLKLKNPFLMAPLAGITDSAFRKLCAGQGAALVYSEMISAKGLYYNDKSTERLLKFDEDEKPLGYQLFGSEPDIIKWAVKKLHDREHSLIDINMGCPVPKVVKNGEGSALLKNIDLAARIVGSAVAGEKEAAEESGKQPRPVTVKFRIGWDENSICAAEFAQAMETAGASAIAVHGRTRMQYYSGKADWDKIADVKRAVKIPVIGNGDVFTGQDALGLMDYTGCDLVMIARGALGNPWIFNEAVALWEKRAAVTGPAKIEFADDSHSHQDLVTVEEKMDMLKRHIQLAVADKGERIAIKEMRKHVGWYLKGVRGAAQIRREVNSVTTLEAIEEIVDSVKGL